MPKFLTVVILLSASCFFGSCSSQTTSKEQPSQGDAQKMISEVLTLEAYKAKIANGNVQLVDVRTPEEVAEGKIMDAINIDYNDDNFKAKIASLKKDEPIYIYCRSGNRSGKSAVIMQELGFQEIYDLKGGYDAWSEAQNN